MKFSRGRVNAFYGADPSTKDSIREDVLKERYVDLLDEKENLENILNIPESEHINMLYDINIKLFDILETLVPEAFAETEELVEEESRVNAVAQNMKAREMKARQMRNQKEKMLVAKNNIQTAQLRFKNAQTPKDKAREMDNIRKARKALSQTTVQGKDAEK